MIHIGKDNHENHGTGLGFEYHGFIIQKNTTSAVNEDTNESESDDLQEAIDFLNNLSMSTSIDGVVLSIINYLIQLYKTASDAGIPNAFGTAIGVGGLITGVVADIMGGMNSGLSQNAIIADVIVDVALWGVAEYGDDVGQAECICD